MWRVLAAVLWLRNVRFVNSSEESGSSDDHAAVDGDETIARVAAALGCEVEPLRLALLRKKISVAGELIEQRYNIRTTNTGRRRILNHSS